MKVDLFCGLFLLRPRCMTVLHLELHAHLGCRRNTSADAHASASVDCEERKDIRALGWCPGPVVFRLQLYLLIFYKQPQLIGLIWVVLDCDLCMLPEMSRVDLDWSEVAHRLGRGSEYDERESARMRASRRGAHRLAMFVHFADTWRSRIRIGRIGRIGGMQATGAGDGNGPRGNTRLASGCAAWPKLNPANPTPTRTTNRVQRWSRPRTSTTQLATWTTRERPRLPGEKPHVPECGQPSARYATSKRLPLQVLLVCRRPMKVPDGDGGKSNSASPLFYYMLTVALVGQKHRCGHTISQNIPKETYANIPPCSSFQLAIAFCGPFILLVG